MNRRSLLGWLAKAPVALAAVSLPGACASVPVMAGEGLTTHQTGYVPTFVRITDASAGVAKSSWTETVHFPDIGGNFTYHWNADALAVHAHA
jgi:hypothetical protein